MIPGQVVLIVNLLQDVNILRPLAYIAARDLKRRTLILVTPAFKVRDKQGIWQRELAEVAADTGASVAYYNDDLHALHMLSDKTGVMVAASESDLNAHKPVHELFRMAPSSYLRVTLQHGFECVGFLQSHDQDLAHGEAVTFAADVICGWCEAERMISIVPSQLPKLYVTGPTAVLQAYPSDSSVQPLGMGLVCENMHSPRLNVAGDFKTDFLGVFNEFCNALQKKEEKVTLRPHPGGQYTLKNQIPLPPNVVLNNAPIYKVNLSRYAYGISAPSSILIDMVLAGIPVAVWHDTDSIMDLGNYEGLTKISGLGEWLDFSREAVAHPEKFIELQRRFLGMQKMLIRPEEVYLRYTALLGVSINSAWPGGRLGVEPERILFVANGFTPTLQLSFIKPLAPAAASGRMWIDVISEIQINREFKGEVDGDRALEWLRKRIVSFRPTVVVFSRYSGPHAPSMLECIRGLGVPSIYHIDDDLLHIPEDVGLKKYQHHNDSKRLETIRYLLDNVTLVYSSTQRLKARLIELCIKVPVVDGDIYCSGQVITTAVNRPIRKVGYMGIGHEKNLASILPALIKFMTNNSNIIFEFFGTIPVPEEFKEFGDRVKFAPKIDNYEEFLQRFSEYEWDIGICPLTPIPFNMMKANTKWVEYTSVGTAVVASKGTVYDECCADGCGILAETEDEWLAALEKLTRDPEERFRQVSRAQEKLEREYSVGRLREQVVGFFEQAKKISVPAIFSESELGYKKNKNKHERILYIANSFGPTLQLSFVKPLAPLVESGEMITDLITEEQMKQRLWKKHGYASTRAWLRERIVSFRPTVVVFSRYSGPHAEWMLKYIREMGAFCVYHIDDDLLHIPEDIGLMKYQAHNKPERLATVRYLLDNSTLIYCSTEKLKVRLTNLSVKSPVVAGNIYCSGQVINAAQNRPVRKVGYMASADHAHNLDKVLAAITNFMRRNPEVDFEFFGTIPVPEEFKEFGDRVKFAPKIDNYEEFLQRFSEYEWDIGICPLTSIPFNMMKANTKWVEYSAVGTAVVASKGTVYDECCADGCGILAETEDEWLAALEKLTRDPEERFRQVSRAQEKLEREYSVGRLREQVIGIFSQAKEIHEREKQDVMLSKLSDLSSVA